MNLNLFALSRRGDIPICALTLYYAFGQYAAVQKI